MLDKEIPIFNNVPNSDNNEEVPKSVREEVRKLEAIIQASQERLREIEKSTSLISEKVKKDVEARISQRMEADSIENGGPAEPLEVIFEESAIGKPYDLNTRAD